MKVQGCLPCAMLLNLLQAVEKTTKTGVIFFFGIQIMGIVGSYSSPKVAFNIL